MRVKTCKLNCRNLSDFCISEKQFEVLCVASSLSPSEAVVVLTAVVFDTSMIVGFHQKTSMKDGCHNFWQKFKNASEQMLAIFSKILRPIVFSTGTILILGTQLSYFYLVNSFLVILIKYRRLHKKYRVRQPKLDISK